MGRGVGDGEGNLDSFGEGGELGNKERGIWEQGEGNLGTRRGEFGNKERGI